MINSTTSGSVLVTESASTLPVISNSALLVVGEVASSGEIAGVAQLAINSEPTTSHPETDALRAELRAAVPHVFTPSRYRLIQPASCPQLFLTECLIVA